MLNKKHQNKKFGLQAEPNMPIDLSAPNVISSVRNALKKLDKFFDETDAD